MLTDMHMYMFTHRHIYTCAGACSVVAVVTGVRDDDPVHPHPQAPQRLRRLLGHAHAGVRACLRACVVCLQGSESLFSGPGSCTVLRTWMHIWLLYVCASTYSMHAYISPC
jgi:hypothetical protein